MLNAIELAQVDLNLLVLFDVVLHERHVGRTGARLGVSPSAVSHGLGRLRAQLQDPLFLKTPKGVVPTARALELADTIAEILARARSVFATGQPFVAATSERRFVLGAPDAVSAVILPPLLAAIRAAAPGIDVGIRTLLPHMVIDALDGKEIDVAIAPLPDLPARFSARLLYQEEFVVVARIGHPFLDSPTIARYCAEQHVLVSISGDPRGHVDQALARRKLTRRVALVVPSFMLALAAVAESNLLTAVPRALVTAHAHRFAVASAELPFRLGRDAMRAITPTVALRDAGIAWFVDTLAAAVGDGPRRSSGPSRHLRPRSATRMT